MLTLNSQKTDRSLTFPLVIITMGIMLVGIYIGAMILLPAPKPRIDQEVKSSTIDTGKMGSFAWPKSQQSAIGMTGYSGVIAGYQEQKPIPIASVAKVITALAVLEKKKLSLDQQGPEITLTAADVDLYNSYKSKGGSVVKVTAGEKISQYQLMQGMLIPSANNMAASLATWAFGSESAYTEYANKMLDKLGLKYTHVDDASGFSPKTVSTASDLVAIGKLVIANPVIAQITSQHDATIPTAGNVVTTNSVLGQAGIIGIKTGHTPESGGCFLFAADKQVGDQKVTVIGVVLAAATIDEARASAPKIVEEGFANIAQATALGVSAPVGTMVVPWSDSILVVAKKGLVQTAWRGAKADLTITLTPGDTTGTVGFARLGADSTELVVQHEVPPPSIWWRLTHPIDIILGATN